MSDALDLGPIKARLEATTPGEWKWIDELLRDIPYNNETWAGDKHIPTGNDGALGVQGLFAETPIDAENESYLDPVLEARDDDDDIPEDPGDPGSVDLSIWRGVIQAGNAADLIFIANAKADVEALIAEVERLRPS
jgi:hypothetical protein